MNPNPDVRKYVRFERAGSVAYGLLENGAVRELAGGLFDGGAPTGRVFPAAEVHVLVPCEPGKVLAVGLNYASHRVHVERAEGGIRNAAGKPVPTDRPGVFAKFPTSLIPDGADIVLPEGATKCISRTRWRSSSASARRTCRPRRRATTCSASRSATTSSTANGC